MSFGWHPREHRAALNGMLMLTLEERGAYNTLLDLIYDRSGPIPDDARWLAGWMGCSVRRWNQLRASLLAKGKIYEINLNGAPCLMNERAAKEIENQAKLSRNLSESGAKGGRKRAENAAASNENNDIDQAPAQARLKLKTETKTVDKEANASSGDALFVVAWKACTAQMRKRSKAQDKTRPLWTAAARKAGSEQTLLDALRRYLREDPDVGRTGGPGFHIWLADGRWSEYLAKPETAAAAASPDVIAWRVQRYRETGEWRPTWGPRPENIAA